MEKLIWLPRIAGSFVLVLLSLSSVHSQQPQSFKAGIDCNSNNRNSPLGRWVCTDAEAEALSTQLNQAFRAIQTAADQAERGRLQQANNAWLDEIDAKCIPDTSKKCVLDMLKSRLLSLGVQPKVAQRATPALEAQASPSSGKASFDCAKAKSPSARLICSDAELINADGALGKAFQNVVRSLSPDDKKNKIREQVTWLRERNRRCKLDDKLAVPVEELAEAKPCMLSWISIRIGELAGTASQETIRAAAGPATAASPDADLYKVCADTASARNVSMTLKHLVS
jgi:uncharacterized protein YecT (DUF1311 family)